MVSTWNSEDDELLKNAIEAGTSLESLSKGAVQLSQRFTDLQELKDGWHSHTYYDNSSVDPSPHSIECVDSDSTPSPKLHNLEYKGEISGLKRKMNDDGRDRYSPMLNRVRSSVVENRDNTQSTDYMYGEAKQDQPSERLNDPFCSEAEKLVRFNETSLTYGDIDICNFGDILTLPQIPTQNTCESIFELTLPERQVEEKESAANTANYEFFGCDVQSNTTDQIPFYNMENLAPSTDGNLAGSSAPFMELRDVEEFLFTDTDENDIANTPGLDLLFFDFSWEVNVAKHSNIPGGGACSGDDVNYAQLMNYWSESATLTSISASNPELPNGISDDRTLPSAPAANNHEHHIACAPEGHLSVPANSVVYTSCFPQLQILPSKPNVDPELLCNGVIRCVLNTEDTEIPCNDDALFTLSSRRRSRPSRNSSKKKHQLRGIKAYYLAETMKEKPDSSETIQSKKALYVQR